MSKNYVLYSKYERKIDNWRRRILGYEKMKRDMQRQIQILKNKNKNQKEVIDKAIELLNNPWSFESGNKEVDEITYNKKREIIDILKEVSE